jgi:hypothetical protein
MLPPGQFENREIGKGDEGTIYILGSSGVMASLVVKARAFKAKAKVKARTSEVKAKYSLQIFLRHSLQFHKCYNIWNFFENY